MKKNWHIASGICALACGIVAVFWGKSLIPLLKWALSENPAPSIDNLPVLAIFILLAAFYSILFGIEKIKKSEK